MDGSRNHHVKQNKQDLETKIACSLSHAESSPLKKKDMSVKCGNCLKMGTTGGRG
jgi:hypothetical protein